MTKRLPWSEEEIELLRTHYPEKGIIETMKILYSLGYERTRRSVENQVSIQKISKLNPEKGRRKVLGRNRYG